MFSLACDDPKRFARSSLRDRAVSDSMNRGFARLREDLAKTSPELASETFRFLRRHPEASDRLAPGTEERPSTPKRGRSARRVPGRRLERRRGSVCDRPLPFPSLSRGVSTDVCLAYYVGRERQTSDVGTGSVGHTRHTVRQTRQTSRTHAPSGVASMCHWTDRECGPRLARLMPLCPFTRTWMAALTRSTPHPWPAALRAARSATEPIPG